MLVPLDLRCNVTHEGASAAWHNLCYWYLICLDQADSALHRFVSMAYQFKVSATSHARPMLSICPAGHSWGTHGCRACT